MFDPTIYENLKVVLEGEVYDLDLSNEISVINRKDIINLATMSRIFSIKFQSRHCKSSYPIVKITLQSSIEDFASEKLEKNENEAGCTLEISYFTLINDPKLDCPEIENHIKQIWDERPSIHQEISFTYGNEKKLVNKIILTFGRKINEDQIDDFQNIIDLNIKTLHFLQQR